MRKSLFTKYFVICATLILAAVSLIGAVMVGYTTQYLKESKERILSNNIDRANAVYYSNYISEIGQTLNRVYLQSTLTSLAAASNSSMFIADIEGTVALHSDITINVLEQKTVSKVIIRKAISGYYSELGTLCGLYTEKCYTVCKPIKIDGDIKGFLFASSSMNEVNSFMAEIAKVFLTAALCVITILSITLLCVTRRMKKPLTQLNSAMSSFTHGDFSVRVPKNEESEEISALADSFNLMADSLATTENSRRSFVANVSHELKTPMTTIAGFIDGILDGTIPKENERHYLTIVSDEVKRLARLVVSMLNISKIEAGEMKIQETCFNMTDVMFTALFSFEKSIDEKSIEVRGCDNLEAHYVIADKDLIHQVIYNIIDNAIKFTNNGGYLEFSAYEKNNTTYFSVKNSGDGVRSDELSRIFDRFYKTDRSRGLDKKGVGLGLYIVKQIINLHGGEITADSVLGEYTVFTFTLKNAKKRQRAIEKETDKNI